MAMCNGSPPGRTNEDRGESTASRSRRNAWLASLWTYRRRKRFL